MREQCLCSNGIRVVRRPDAAGGALCLSSVYAAKVVAPLFFDRRGQQRMPMNPR